MKDITLIMLKADEVAKKNFSQRLIKNDDLKTLTEIYDFFYEYIDVLTLELSPEEKEKIWNKNIINLCFKTYLFQHHKFKISEDLIIKINNQ
jgi:hypothetical protein